MPAAAQPSTEQVQGSASSAGHGSGWKDREPPPGFDGRNPDKVFPRWVKELELWKFETEIPKEKWGVKVFRQLQGSAKSVADGLSFEELACEKGLDNLMKVLKDHYQPHLQVSLPKAFEEAIFGDVRSAKESFSDYVIRSEHNFKELQRQGVELHDLVVGYVLFRHANLTDVQEAQMLTWGGGKYDRKTVIENLRKLEKGIFDVKRRNTAYLLDAEDPEKPEDPPENNETFPHVEDEGDSDGDDDYVYVGEDDLREVYEEEQMMEALATYQDVRRSLREQKTNRGYYPSGKGAQSSSKGTGKGKGLGRSRPVMDFKGRFKDPVKVGKGGTKVHIDLLKLRTKCARCGQVGHWARECRGVPDDRGRNNMPKSPSVAQSSSSPSTRSGFFVESSGDRPGSVLYGENNSVSLMSYAPTLGSIMSMVLNRGAQLQLLEPVAQREQPKDSFVGVTTRAGEGVVDTAAQDGLIGKAALLELTSVLRERGLQIKWNNRKQAQASGVGGKAKVIGIAEIPVGVAGVNGLLEATVVQENIPLLLPIRMLKQLRAVVDLEQDRLLLKAYGVETDMHAMPSGHMSVSVTDYAPEGWSLPRAAESEYIKREQFVLASSGFLQSMYPLEGSTGRRVQFEVGEGHGPAASASHDGPEKPGRTDSSWRDASWSPAKSSCHSTLEDFRGQNDGSHGTRKSARKGVGLAARWLATAVGAGAIHGAADAVHLGILNANGIGQAARVLPDHQGLSLPRFEEEQRGTHQVQGAVRTSYYGTERWRKPILQGGVVQCVQGPMGLLDPGQVAGEDQGDKSGSSTIQLGTNGNCTELNGQAGDVQLWQGGEPLGSQERRADERAALLQVPQSSMRLLPVGRDRAEEPQGRHEAQPWRDGGADGVGQPGEYDQGAAGRMESQGRISDAEPSQGAPRGSGPVEGPTGVDAKLPESAPRPELSSECGWLSAAQREVSRRGLPAHVDSENVCLVLTEPQAINARKHQMQTFCLRASTPWSMPLSRVFYKWDDECDVWVQHVGWVPRDVHGDMYLVVFDDKENMVLWSEETGKLKALSAGERKHCLKKVQKALEDVKVTNQSSVIEAVSPKRVFQFVEYDQAMAILDPLGEQQFWSQLKAQEPICLILQPGRDQPNLQLACEAAEWQHVQNGVFAVVCDGDDEEYVRKEMRWAADVYGAWVDESRCVLSNHAKCSWEVPGQEEPEPRERQRSSTEFQGAPVCGERSS